MITWNRTSSFPAPNAAQAMTFAHEIAAYIKAKMGVDVQVSMPVGGNPFRVRWTSQFTDMGAWEANNAQLLRDAQYMAMVAKGAAHFVAGSANDEFWTS